MPRSSSPNSKVLCTDCGVESVKAATVARPANLRRSASGKAPVAQTAASTCGSSTASLLTAMAILILSRLL